MKTEYIYIICASAVLMLTGIYPLIEIIKEREFEAVIIIVFSLAAILCSIGLMFKKKWARRWTNILLLILIAVLYLEPMDNFFRYSYNEQVRYWSLGSLYVLSFVVINLPSLRKLFS